MKKILSVLSFFLVSTTLVFPQKVSVLKLQQVTDKSLGEFYYPKLSPDGSKLFFTTANFSGLWYYDFQSKKVTQFTDQKGAGYQFAFSDEGSSVIYRTNEYNENGLRISQSLVKKDISTLNEQKLGTGTDLSVATVFPNRNIAFTSSDKLSVVSAVSDANGSKTASVVSVASQPMACIEHQKIAVYSGENKKILSPMGEGSYIWPSVSPDGSKLLFTLAGKGTYVSDLDGNVIADLGYANAPKWSPDGKWIVFMNDKDNGLSVTSSDIFAYSLVSQQKTQLTDSKDIHEMYPEWSFDGQKIVFNSEDGKIFLMELKAE